MSEESPKQLDTDTGVDAEVDMKKDAVNVDRFARSLQRKVTEAAYLTAQNHERYRAIMRFFYRQHMAHQYALSLDDVFSYVRSFADASYTEEQCEQDLAQLCEWGNLSAEQDRSRARTVEEFLRRRLRYSVTAYGVAFERLLVELEQGTGSGGSLDPSLLERLADLLQQLDAAVTALFPQVGKSAPEAPASDLREVYNLWNQAFDTFDKIGRQASDYLGELHRAQQDDLTDIEVFLAYKDVLLQYLNSFVTGLYDVGDAIAQLLRRQMAKGWPAPLVEALVAFETKHVPLPTTGALPTSKDVRARRSRQWRDLVRWFERRGGLETLRRSTTAAIERVVRQSQRVMDRRSGLSRRRELEEIAVGFARLDGMGEAHRLAAIAWGCIIPRHITGSAEVFSLEPSGSVWEQSPQDIELTSVSGGGPGLRRSFRPVRLQDERQRRAIDDELDRRRAERQVWDALFADGEVDLGDLTLDRPELRARLLAVLAECLASPDRSCTAPDGSTVTLLFPDENNEATGLLRGPDGALALPRFRLRRTLSRTMRRVEPTNERASERASSISSPVGANMVAAKDGSVS